MTYYDTVNGKMIGESSGGVTTTYLADELGSVVATAQGGAIVNRYRYSPYGGLVSRTGTGTDPLFMWVGVFGYRATGRKAATSYIRARHFDSVAAIWLSRDLIWPRERSFSYVANRPNSSVDPTGLARNVESAVFGSCGSFNVWWTFDGIDNKFTGWLLQHIAMTQDVTVCGDGSVPNMCCGHPSCDYWEAWKVIKGAIFIPSLYESTFTWFGPIATCHDHFVYGPDKSCTSGSASYKAETWLLTDPAPRTFPKAAGWNWPDGRACSGYLPRSYDFKVKEVVGLSRYPDLDGSASTTSWGCCKPSCGPLLANCGCTSIGSCGTPTNFPDPKSPGNPPCKDDR